MKKVIIVSAVNIVEAGPLTVLQGCFRHLSEKLSDKYEIIALVNNKKVCLFNNINYIEIKEAKKSWIYRLYFEYYYFAKLAKRFNPFLWLSLHDMTPRVKADRRAVYCHNPSPFYKLSFKEARLDPRFTLFSFFYKYLYRINIQANDFVIAQQDWLRQELIKLCKINNIIVAHPEVDNEPLLKKAYNDESSRGNEDFLFFYPALPRVFKNFEVICKASEILLKQGVHNFKVIFTISGKENWYSKYIYNSFKHIINIKFLGIQSRDNVFRLYNSSNCLIFPSKLETWGIPISEAKLFKKPLLLADLNYAHETLGTYDKAKFFDPGNPEQLADEMKAMINGTVVYERIESGIIPEPFSQSWEELFNVLLGSNPEISLEYNIKVRQPANV